MASVQSVEQEFVSQQKRIGRAALSALFPKDIESYFLALELIDGTTGDTVDYFAWPVLPDEIKETHQEITTVRKTIGGVYVLKNSTFTPRSISLSGTFGRRFKILINSNQLTFAGFSLSRQNGVFSITPPNILGQDVPQFSSFAKNGYGCIKVLESMKEKSKQLNLSGKPYALYFYNPILGNNYQVEINTFMHMQDKDQHNMVPAYSLQMTAVAPLDSVVSILGNIVSAGRNLTMSALQRGANNVAANLRLLPGF